jgi:hypothetical protein
MKFSILIFPLLTLACFSCQTTKKKTQNYEKKTTLADEEDNKPSLKRNCNYSAEEDTLKQSLFPFQLKNFDTQIILKYFSNGTKVDSSKSAGEENEYRIYTL